LAFSKGEKGLSLAEGKLVFKTRDRMRKKKKQNPHQGKNQKKKNTTEKLALQHLFLQEKTVTLFPPSSLTDKRICKIVSRRDKRLG